MVALLLNVFLAFALCGLYFEMVTDKIRIYDECQSGLFTGYTLLLRLFLITGIILLILVT
jgi:hypothetical protein